MAACICRELSKHFCSKMLQSGTIPADICGRENHCLMATKKKAAASKKVGTVMHEFKQGQLKSGGSGKKVTNPKQAVAIGLSEARKSGASVPPAKKKGAVKKNASKTTA